MGDWTVTASFGQWQFGQREWFPNADTPAWDKAMVGGMVVAQLSANEFLFTGDHVRVQFGSREGARPTA